MSETAMEKYEIDIDEHPADANLMDGEQAEEAEAEEDLESGEDTSSLPVEQVEESRVLEDAVHAYQLAQCP